MDALIDYIESSNYFTANCHGHHFIGKGGVAQHSMEVYTFMKDHNVLRLDDDSLIITALCHDLGKTYQASKAFRGRHDERSLKVLQKFGVPLSEAEQTAILNHVPGWAYRTLKATTCPLYALLVAGDCYSAKTWKHSHADAVAERKARRAKRRASSREHAHV